MMDPTPANLACLRTLKDGRDYGEIRVDHSDLADQSSEKFLALTFLGFTILRSGGGFTIHMPEGWDEDHQSDDDEDT